MRAPSIKTALVVYKKSAWEQHVARKGGVTVTNAATRRAMLDAHKQNSLAIDEVRRALSEAGVRFRFTSRADIHPKESPNGERDLVISIGGDGTFLEASHQVWSALQLGVNSSPDHSVGFFCAATRKTFASVLDRALEGKLKVTLLHRLEIRLRGKRLPHLALNDLLLTHQNPGATSRYTIRAGGRKEKQRSSGIWISTASGSTAGIRAAGGVMLPITSDAFQYAVREVYVPPGERNFKLRRGVLRKGAELQVICGMVDGAIFIDGPRHRSTIGLGDEVRVRVGNHPLKVLGFDAIRRAR